MRKLFEIINKNMFLSRVDGLFRSSVAKQTEHPSLITISREYGSGGSIIAKKLAKKLGTGWRVFHDEIVSEIAKDIRLEKKLIREVDENKIPLIDEVVGDFFGKRYVNLNTYAKSLVKTLSTIGNRGSVIIVGRGANYLFPSALKVRIVGDMEERIKAIMQYERISRVKAERLTLQKDKERVNFTRTIFHHDPRKAHHYDMIIKTGSHLSVDDATSIIYFLAKRWFKA